jgi:DNA-binding response OmpR family regulator
VLLDTESDSGELLERIGAALGARNRVPVLVLMPRGHLEGWLLALEHGAADIIVVPFLAEELLARMFALLKRAYGRPIMLAPIIRVGGLEINLVRRQVRVDDVEVQLTSAEQSLLYLLAANAGRVLTRDEILDAVWGMDFASDSNVVDQYVRRLRAKMQDHWQRPRFIATTPGRGYRFLVTEAVEPGPYSISVPPPRTRTTDLGEPIC